MDESERIAAVVVAGSVDPAWGGEVFRWSGLVVVGAVEMYDLINSGTLEGVTESMKVKAGSRRTVVGCWPLGCSWEWEGRGMLEAESMSFWHRVQCQQKNL